MSGVLVAAVGCALSCACPKKVKCVLNLFHFKTHVQLIVSLEFLLTLLPLSIGGVSTCMLGTKQALCACRQGLMAVACGMIVCACNYPCVTVKVPVF